MSFQTVHIESKGNKRFIPLPHDFQSEGDKFYLKRVGELIYLIPCHEPWKSFWDSLDLFSEDFLQDRSQPSTQLREEF